MCMYMLYMCMCMDMCLCMCMCMYMCMHMYMLYMYMCMCMSRVGFLVLGTRAHLLTGATRVGEREEPWQLVAAGERVHSGHRRDGGVAIHVRVTPRGKEEPGGEEARVVGEREWWPAIQQCADTSQRLR